MSESTEKQTVVERASGLADEVLESVDVGRRDAIEAVRKFVSTLEEATPALVDPSLRKTALDSALDLADELSSALMSLLRSITAARIYCHPNTVRHRLHRIQELTGRSLSRPRDLAELCLVFEVERRLP